MSDQTDSQVANVDTNSSQEAVSQQQSGETQSGNSLAGAALADKVRNDKEAYQALREEIRREFQSSKDKGVDEVRKKLKELEDQLNSQESPGEVVTEERRQPASNVNIEAIKRAYPDIKLDDPDVLPRIAGLMGDAGGLMAELDRIQQGRQNKPKPTAASVAPPAGATQSTSSASEMQDQIDAHLGNQDLFRSDPKGYLSKLKEMRKRLQEIEQA